MKLTIKREQKEQKGMFGGHKGMTFLLSCRVELTPEERELIAKYKAEEQPLTYNRAGEPGLRISSLVRGVRYEVKDVTTLLNNEDVIKDACKEFKTLLMVMASFGGEETIEF